jgi:hypothetical protein
MSWTFLVKRKIRMEKGSPVDHGRDSGVREVNTRQGQSG